MLIIDDICDTFIMVIIMKNKIISVLIAIWIVVAIFTTVCLLSFNKYRVAEFGKYSIFTVDTDILEPDFSEGSLLITKKTNHKHIEAGDNIFYYEADSSDSVVNIGTVTKKEEVTATEATLTMQNEQKISMQYVLGKEDAAIAIPVLGTILSIIESKWGYMFLVIFPTILIIVYEIFAVINEIKSSKEEQAEKKEEVKKNEIEEL